jgi:hypothetical protein
MPPRPLDRLTGPRGRATTGGAQRSCATASSGSGSASAAGTSSRRPTAASTGESTRRSHGQAGVAGAGHRHRHEAPLSVASRQGDRPDRQRLILVTNHRCHPVGSPLRGRARRRHQSPAPSTMERCHPERSRGIPRIGRPAGPRRAVRDQVVAPDATRPSQLTSHGPIVLALQAEQSGDPSARGLRPRLGMTTFLDGEKPPPRRAAAPRRIPIARSVTRSRRCG